MTDLDVASSIAHTPDLEAYRSALNARAELTALNLQYLGNEHANEFILRNGALLTELGLARGVLISAVRERIGQVASKNERFVSREDYGQAIAPVGTTFKIQTPAGNILPLTFTDNGLSTPDNPHRVSPRRLFLLSMFLKYPGVDFTREDFLKAGFAPEAHNKQAQKATLSNEMAILEREVADLLHCDRKSPEKPIIRSRQGHWRFYRWDYPVIEIQPPSSETSGTSEAAAGAYDLENKDGLWRLFGEPLDISDLQKALLSFLYVVPTGIDNGISAEQAARFLKPLNPKISPEAILAAAEIFNSALIMRAPEGRRLLAEGGIVIQNVPGKGRLLRFNAGLKRPELNPKEREEFMADLSSAIERARSRT